MIIEKIEELQKFKEQQAEEVDETMIQVLYFIVTKNLMFADMAEDPKDIDIDDAVKELQQRLKTCDPY